MPTNTSFPFSLNVLKQIARFCSHDESRYSLNGINFALDPSKDVVVRATDGRKLIEYRSHWEHTATEPVNFTLDFSVVQAITADREQDMPRLEFDNAAVKLAFQRFSVEALIIDGIFPSFKAVIPNPLPEHFPPSRVRLNEEFLATVLEVMAELNPSATKGVTITCKGELEPLCFQSRQTLVVLMPMRVL